MENKITQHPITSFSKSIDPHSYMNIHVSIDNHWIYQYFLVHASKKIPHKITKALLLLFSGVWGNLHKYQGNKLLF